MTSTSSPLTTDLVPVCERCDKLDTEHDQRCPEHPDHDPTPYCTVCGPRSACDCGPRAEND